VFLIKNETTIRKKNQIQLNDKMFVTKKMDHILDFDEFCTLCMLASAVHGSEREEYQMLPTHFAYDFITLTEEATPELYAKTNRDIIQWLAKYVETGIRQQTILVSDNHPYASLVEDTLKRVKSQT